MVVVLLSVTVVLPCVALVAMLRSAVTITAARIMVADGDMVPVPSLLVWRSVPPLVPQQPPHIIIIMAVTPRITVRHLTNSHMADDWRRGFGRSQCSSFAFGVRCGLLLLSLLSLPRQRSLVLTMFMPSYRALLGY
jgi:hypothetical protein